MAKKAKQIDPWHFSICHLVCFIEGVELPSGRCSLFEKMSMAAEVATALLDVPPNVQGVL
jgi:hypothetical protein